MCVCGVWETNVMHKVEINVIIFDIRLCLYICILYTVQYMVGLPSMFSIVNQNVTKNSTEKIDC